MPPAERCVHDCEPSACDDGCARPGPEIVRARIVYTNHRGATELRCIVPARVYYGATTWHPEPQWLLVAWDDDRGAVRTFALRDVHGWDTATEDPDAAG
jgi:predicted DNA-binding transcriptional regulator YafY